MNIMAPLKYRDRSRKAEHQRFERIVYPPTTMAAINLVMIPNVILENIRAASRMCADQSLLMNVHNPRSSEIAFYSQFDYQVNISLCENMSVFNKHIEIGIFSAISVELCFSEQKYPPPSSFIPEFNPENRGTKREQN